MSAGGGTAVSWKASAGALPKDSAAINPAMANILRIEISPLLKMAFGVTQCKHVWSAVNTLLRLRNFLPLRSGVAAGQQVIPRQLRSRGKSKGDCYRPVIGHSYRLSL